MWAIEAKAKIDIPLGEDISKWTNEQFKKFINRKRTSCGAFDAALDWLGDKNAAKAMRDCTNKTWLNWLQSNAPKNEGIVKAGETITVTHGKNEKYALWCGFGIYDLPEEYVGETVRVICNG